MKTELILNLQDIVDSYKDPAVLINDKFEIINANTAYLNLYNVHLSNDNTNAIEHIALPLSSPGKSYCYTVSHRYSHSCDQEGESCPLQLAKSTKSNQRVLHVHHTLYGEEHVDVNLSPVRDFQGNMYFLEVMKTIKHASPISVQQGLVGRSPKFNKLVDLINRVADYDVSVLLQGASGSGKELVAHAIHQASQRHSMACVTVECSGLSESLFESELFGHEKGAFTGAIYKKKGLVEEAEYGTLFLDEIGDVPLSLQIKLLRLIETRTFRRVGGVEQLTTDFRLVCATHKNLKKMVRRGEFREDLYYRISTFPIKLPALRERKADIPLLVETLLERITGHKKMRVATEVMEFFQNYSFPGNVRELRNLLELGRVMSDSNVIELQHLPEELLNNDMVDEIVTKKATGQTMGNKAFIDFKNIDSIESIKTLDQLECDYLLWLSFNFKGDNKELAECLGVSERTLYRKLKCIE